MARRLLQRRACGGQPAFCFLLGMGFLNTAPEESSLWIRRIVDPDQPHCVIYWFAHAGGGTASMLRDAADLRSQTALRAIKLPGREERSGEEPVRDLAGLARTVAETIRADCGELPFALAGHSFGGLLAYRAAKELIAIGRIPNLFTAVAAPPPNRMHGGPPLYNLPDEELAEKLDKNVGGIPERIRHDPVALRHFLPVVRADLCMLETYEHAADETPLPISLLAVGGTNDTVVSSDVLLGWRAFTEQRFALRMMPGDHFFPTQHLALLVQTIGAACLRGENVEA